MDIVKIIRGTILGIVAGIVGGVCICNLGRTGGTKQTFAEQSTESEIKEYQDSLKIQNKILRFHVKANSNSEKDLELKYKVRDSVLSYVKEELEKVKNKNDAIYVLKANINKIQKAAESCIKEQGYDYEVKVDIKDETFPMRQYGDICLPAGLYDALIIEIGEAKGENFWCMLYPSICFTTDSAAVVDSKSKKDLKRALTDEEYKEIFIKTEARNEKRVRVRFKILDIFTK